VEFCERVKGGGRCVGEPNFGSKGNASQRLVAGDAIVL